MVLPRAPIATPGYFCFVFERIGRAIGRALIQPEAVPLRIGTGGLDEARLVDQAEIFPAVIAAGLQARMRRQRLQEIERAIGGDANPVPEPIVAGGPDDPRVPSLDFLGRERHAAVHVAEVVFVGGRERRGVASDASASSSTRPASGERFLTQRNSRDGTRRPRPREAPRPRTRRRGPLVIRHPQN